MERQPADACDQRITLDGFDPSIRASGHAVVDMGVARRVRRGLELNLTVDNLASRRYWGNAELLRVAPAGEEPASRIHATPGYPLTIMAGMTFRFHGK